MSIQTVSLADKFDLSKRFVLLNGTQALVRLMLAQKARDIESGWNTAGYVTGYRGSPLGAVDLHMQRASAVLSKADIIFQEGLNEDLAATALWGAQQAELRGEGRFDGVFGLWYGKGPGVDRSGDVMRHANMAGSSAKGGVVMAMGDDHTGESSSILHQSDWAMVDAHIPVISPAGVQEILDYGHYAFELSRFSGLWVGLKTMKDTIEVTSVVDADIHRQIFQHPEIRKPDHGLNIRLVDTAAEQETRLLQYKVQAAEAFARANKIDRCVHSRADAKIGFVAAGKNWLDLVHALSLLNLDEAEAERLGITTYKVAQTWPLDKLSLREWAEGLDLIVVVEEKRKLIEVQIKEALFDDARAWRVYGGTKGLSGEQLFAIEGALDPIIVAEKLGAILIEEGCSSAGVDAGMERLSEARRLDNVSDIALRTPYFCAGCPHNSSTKLPEGSRAYAGIGCHFMAQWMERETLGFTQMGGEGANWIGEEPFSTRSHVFQNLGDGTYNHSGILAIRAAVAADANITYKILFNDAVAMTGGQGNDGGLTALRITQELIAMNVSKIALVYDEKEDIDLKAFPKTVSCHERAEMLDVQKRMSKVRGVSAIVYVQTCAAEKRRRRKKNMFQDPDQRIFINPEICEGCGDCGIQSNCVAILPVDTELGRKRAIDQSSCNKDFSCVNGFCPSFVSLEGAQPKTRKAKSITLPNLPKPIIKPIKGTHNVVITGIGGTGVVTIGAILAQAAHLDGKGAGMMEMAGLAQKGGAVHIHCRLAEHPNSISAIRVALGECDALIGGDLVVTAGAKTVGLTTQGRTGAVVNRQEVVTGDFTRNADFQIPHDRLTQVLEARLSDDLLIIDSSALARALLGDSVYSNMILFGATWQRGLLPVTYTAIKEAITLNGADVEANQRAFDIGRWVAIDPAQAEETIQPPKVMNLSKSLEEKINFRADHLRRYQSKRLAKRYVTMLNQFDDSELKEAVALGYHKLLSYKDEYEVARLHKKTAALVKDQFEGVKKMSFYLAPPMLSKHGPNGRPQKRKFGPEIMGAFKILAPMKILRGTPFDVFGYSEERIIERRLIRQYEQDITHVKKLYFGAAKPAIIGLARLPLSIKGFGPVKMANYKKADATRKRLLDSIAENSREQNKSDVSI